MMSRYSKKLFIKNLISYFQATTERIIEAKRKAQAARDEAKAAKQRAVELYEKIKSDVRVNQQANNKIKRNTVMDMGKLKLIILDSKHWRSF